MNLLSSWENFLWRNYQDIVHCSLVIVEYGCPGNDE